MASKVKETIQAGSIARVTNKTTGKTLGFLVRSDNSNEFYQVTCTRIADVRIFTCTCKAGQTGFINCTKTGYCKHVAAVLELAEARAALAIEAHNQKCVAEKAVKEAEQIITEKKEGQVLIALHQGAFNIVDFSFSTGMPLCEVEQILSNLQERPGCTITNLGEGNFQIADAFTRFRELNARVKASCEKPLARDLAPLSTNDNFSILKK